MVNIGIDYFFGCEWGIRVAEKWVVKEKVVSCSAFGLGDGVWSKWKGASRWQQMITKWTHQGDVRSERQIWQHNAAKQKKPQALKKAFNKREWIFCEPMAVVFGNTKRRRTPDRLIADIDLHCCVLVILPPGWAAQSTHIPKKKRGGGGINAMSMRNARTCLLQGALRSH